LKNLKRNKAVTLRMTEQELGRFNQLHAKSKVKTQTDFILSLLDKKPIIVIESLREVLTELKRQGNNLNQALRRGFVTPDVLGACWDAYKMLEGAVQDTIINNKSK